MAQQERVSSLVLQPARLYADLHLRLGLLLYAARRGIPNELVQLELKSHREAVRQYPLCESLRFKFAEYGAQQNPVALPKGIIPDSPHSPVIIDTVANDKFHFIIGFQ